MAKKRVLFYHNNAPAHTSVFAMATNSCTLVELLPMPLIHWIWFYWISSVPKAQKVLGQKENFNK